jgi:hypothetical protein
VSTIGGRIGYSAKTSTDYNSKHEWNEPGKEVGTSLSGNLVGIYKNLMLKENTYLSATKYQCSISGENKRDMVHGQVGEASRISVDHGKVFDLYPKNTMKPLYYVKQKSDMIRIVLSACVLFKT